MPSTARSPRDVTDLSRPEEMEERDFGQLLAVYVPLARDRRPVLRRHGHRRRRLRDLRAVRTGRRGDRRRHPHALPGARDRARRALPGAVPAGRRRIAPPAPAGPGERPPGDPRRAHRSAEPASADPRPAVDARPSLRLEVRRARADRHRPLQGDQRRARPPERRHGAPGDRRPVPRADAGRDRRSHRRRRVRHRRGEPAARAGRARPWRRASRTCSTQPFEVAGISVSVRPSIGIAMGPDDGRDADELLQHADVAMYVAKRTGTVKRLYSREPRPLLARSSLARRRAARCDRHRLGRGAPRVPAQARPAHRRGSRRRVPRALEAPAARVRAAGGVPADHREHRADRAAHLVRARPGAEHLCVVASSRARDPDGREHLRPHDRFTRAVRPGRRRPRHATGCRPAPWNSSSPRTHCSATTASRPRTSAASASSV